MTRDKRSTVTKIYFECLHIVWCWKVSPRAATSVLSSPLSQASQLLTFCSQTATFYDKIVIKRFRGGLQEILYNILDRSSLRNRTLEVLRNSSLISTYLLYYKSFSFWLRVRFTKITQTFTHVDAMAVRVWLFAGLMTDSPVSPCPGSLAVAGELQFRNLHYTLPRGAYIVIPQHTQHDGPRLLIYI